MNHCIQNDNGLYEGVGLGGFQRNPFLFTNCTIDYESLSTENTRVLGIAFFRFRAHSVDSMIAYLLHQSSKQAKLVQRSFSTLSRVNVRSLNTTID